MKKFLILLFVCAISFTSCSEGEQIPVTSMSLRDTRQNHIIKTKAIVNIYDTASTDSEVVQQVEYGNMIIAYPVEGTQWAKVHDNYGLIGYIETRHLSERKIYREGDLNGQYKYFNYNNGYNYLFFVMLLLTISVVFGMFSGDEYMLYLKVLGLPISVLFYLVEASSPLWFMYPSIVGWPCVILGFIFYVVMAVVLLKIVFMSIPGADDINFILQMLARGLAAAALLFMVVEFFKCFEWVAFVLLLGMVPTRKYVGSFIDSDGVEHKVYR